MNGQGFIVIPKSPTLHGMMIQARRPHALSRAKRRLKLNRLRSYNQDRITKQQQEAASWTT